MQPRQPALDQLEQVHELNGLFLRHLKTRLAAGQDALGLPDSARALLRRADEQSLMSVATFPRALFDLQIEDDGKIPDRPDSARTRDDAARQALYLSILHCAWTMSRLSVYQTRLLLGLESRAIQRLRALPLASLHALSSSSQLLRCAFRGNEWFWTELLTEMRPEARRRLALVALQPGLSRDWPVRRTTRQSSS